MSEKNEKDQIALETGDTYLVPKTRTRSRCFNSTILFFLLVVFTFAAWLITIYHYRGSQTFGEGSYSFYLEYDAEDLPEIDSKDYMKLPYQQALIKKGDVIEKYEELQDGLDNVLNNFVDTKDEAVDEMKEIASEVSKGSIIKIGVRRFHNVFRVWSGRSEGW